MTDQQYLQLAVVQAEKGLGHTWQNPLVGAVIVKNDQVLALGYHHEYGQPHAEIDAISKLSSLDEANDATIYVTLEPCSHYGKTPPCVDKIVSLGFKRVVIGQLDPNPLVAGKGVARLRNHGIEVTNLNMTQALNSAYNFYFQHQRPMVTAKYAMSLDGKINQAGTQRTRLTGDAAFADSQQLRLANQAILIGERTLQIDHPQLTVRQPLKWPPIRLLLVRDADQLTFDQPLFKTDGPVYLLANRGTQRQLPRNTEVVINNDWSPTAILKFLADKGIQSLLVEGGSHIHAAFVRAQLVDHLVVYLAPMVIGGDGLPSVMGPGIKMPQNFEITSIEPLASDVKVTARRRA